MLPKPSAKEGRIVEIPGQRKITLYYKQSKASSRTCEGLYSAEGEGVVVGRQESGDCEIYSKHF